MMEIAQLLTDGFAVALQPLNIGLVVLGVVLGLFIGAMPGLGSVNGVAILLPMTFLVPPTGAMIFLAAIYYGAMYGGAISSIMLGIPGASTAVATTFDGRPLAMQGKADQALVAAAVASFIGGTISVVLFTGFAPTPRRGRPGLRLSGGVRVDDARVRHLRGPGRRRHSQDAVLHFHRSRSERGGARHRERRTAADLLRHPGFFHGINFLVLAIGIYGIGEILWTLETSKGNVQISQATVNIQRLIASFRKLKDSVKEIVLGSLLGYFVGILPAAGATPGSLMAYGVAKTMSKNPESFGKGNLSGVAAPESANNAASTGSMLPMLTLGIPGSPTTAILLGGMVIWGLEPGPRLFVDQKEFVWGLIASLYVANLAALLVNVAFIPAFIWVLRMPFAILAPMIFVLCVVGGYAPTQDMHDVWLMLLFGVVGYLLRKLDYPMAPAVLAIVLGPLAEASMRSHC